MSYLHTIDNIIVKALYKEDKIHFNKLLKIVCKQHLKITRRVLSSHLSKMYDSAIIDRDPFHPGVERYVWLTKNTRLALDLQIPIQKVKSEKEEKMPKCMLLSETREQRNKKVYLLLMSLATIGFSVPEPVSDNSKVEAGDFYIGNKPHRASTTLPGLSISDFFHNYRDSFNGWRFHNVRFKDPSEVEWYFKKLSQYEPPVIMPVNDIDWIKRERLQKGLPWPIEDETRYGIADKLLHEWLLECIILFGFIERLLSYVWTYRRQATTEEVRWHRFIYGESYSKSYFVKRDGIRRDLKKGGNYFFDGVDTRQPDSAILDHYNKIIDQDIKSCPSCYQKLLEKKYEKIRSKYGIITQMLINIAYPDFVDRSLVKSKKPL